MSLKRSSKSFALANTLAAFVISLPASAQGVIDAPANATGAVAVSDVEASRQIPAMNVLNVHDFNQPVRVQLMKFNETIGSELAGTMLTVVSPDSTRMRYKANDKGEVFVPVKKSGLYALITSGKMGHAAFPIVIRVNEPDSLTSPKQSATPATPTITLPIFTLSPSAAIRAAISFVPPGNTTLSDIDMSLIATGEVTSTVDFRVNLSETGRMEGQVVSLLQSKLIDKNIVGNNLLLYKDGELVARAISDSLGRFAFEELQPGNYGIICAGLAGYAAFGFEAVRPTLSATLPNRETFVTTVAQQPVVGGPFSSGDVLPIVPIPRSLVPDLPGIFQDPERTEDELLPLQADASFAPFPGGGGAGFGGGGGGGAGGGGMGGAGGLLGLAGLGIAAAAAGSGSNDRVLVNPTPDPATPANVLP